MTLILIQGVAGAFADLAEKLLIVFFVTAHREDMYGFTTRASAVNMCARTHVSNNEARVVQLCLVVAKLHVPLW